MHNMQICVGIKFITYPIQKYNKNLTKLAQCWVRLSNLDLTISNRF